ncbi:MAG: hypothetical protein LBU32_19365 [Clostridiales bacterium]|jgi:hypothetical protein|nr:hypothetical protein [Clostridiales bacterium]
MALNIDSLYIDKKHKEKGFLSSPIEVLGLPQMCVAGFKTEGILTLRQFIVLDEKAISHIHKVRIFGDKTLFKILEMIQDLRNTEEGRKYMKKFRQAKLDSEKRLLEKQKMLEEERVARLEKEKLERMQSHPRILWGGLKEASRNEAKEHERRNNPKNSESLASKGILKKSAPALSNPEPSIINLELKLRFDQIPAYRKDNMLSFYLKAFGLAPNSWLKQFYKIKDMAEPVAFTRFSPLTYNDVENLLKLLAMDYRQMASSAVNSSERDADPLKRAGFMLARLPFDPIMAISAECGGKNYILLADALKYYSGVRNKELLSKVLSNPAIFSSKHYSYIVSERAFSTPGAIKKSLPLELPPEAVSHDNKESESRAAAKSASTAPHGANPAPKPMPAAASVSPSSAKAELLAAFSRIPPFRLDKPLQLYLKAFKKEPPSADILYVSELKEFIEKADEKALENPSLHHLLAMLGKDFAILLDQAVTACLWTNENIRLIERLNAMGFDPLMTISADLGGKKEFSIEDLQNYVKTSINAAAIIGMLSNPILFPSQFFEFSKKEGKFALREADGAGEAFFEDFPLLVPASEADNLLKSSCKDRPFAAAKNAFLSVYALYGQIYAKKPPSTSDILDFLAENHFPKGIRINDAAELDKLRALSKTIFGIQLSESNPSIIKALSTVHLIQAGAYEYIHPKNIRISESLLKEIDEYAYANYRLTKKEVFNKFESKIFLSSGLKNQQSLCEVLKLYKDGFKFKEPENKEEQPSLEKASPNAPQLCQQAIKSARHGKIAFFKQEADAPGKSENESYISPSASSPSPCSAFGKELGRDGLYSLAIDAAQFPNAVPAKPQARRESPRFAPVPDKKPPFSETAFEKILIDAHRSMPATKPAEPIGINGDGTSSAPPDASSNEKAKGAKASDASAREELDGGNGFMKLFNLIPDARMGKRLKFFELALFEKASVYLSAEKVSDLKAFIARTSKDTLISLRVQELLEFLALDFHMRFKKLMESEYIQFTRDELIKRLGFDPVMAAFADNDKEASITLFSLYEYYANVEGVEKISSMGQKFFFYSKLHQLFILNEEREEFEKIIGIIDDLPNFMKTENYKAEAASVFSENKVRLMPFAEILFKLSYQLRGRCYWKRTASVEEAALFVASTQFQNGIDIKSDGELAKFRSVAEIMLGKFLPKENRLISEILQKNLIKIKGSGLYISPCNLSVTKKLAEEMFTYVLDSGKAGIYVSELFEAFREKLDKEKVNEANFLSYLECYKKEGVFLYFDSILAISPSTAELSVYKEIQRLGFVRTRYICALFGGLPENAVYHMMKNHQDVTANFETGFLASQEFLQEAFASNQEKDIIMHLKSESPVNVHDLFMNLWLETPELLAGNRIYEPNGLYLLLSLKFAKELSFNYPCIGAKDESTEGHGSNGEEIVISFSP